MSKRWVLFGRRCGEEFYGEHETKDKAKMGAFVYIDAGYDVYLLDQKTDKCYSLRRKSILSGDK